MAETLYKITSLQSDIGAAIVDLNRGITLAAMARVPKDDLPEPIEVYCIETPKRGQYDNLIGCQDGVCR